MPLIMNKIAAVVVVLGVGVPLINTSADCITALFYLPTFIA